MGLAGCNQSHAWVARDGGATSRADQGIAAFFASSDVQMPQISHMLPRFLERCEARIAPATLAAVLQHVAGVRLTLTTGRPSCAPCVVVGAWRWRRWCWWSGADTATLTTVFQHVARVPLTFSTGCPILAILIVIGARLRRCRSRCQSRDRRRDWSRDGSWRRSRCRSRWRRANSAALTTILQHVTGVRLTFSIGSPAFAQLITIGARPRRRLGCWCGRRRRGRCHLEIEARDEDLHRGGPRTGATDTQDPCTWIIGKHNICIIRHIKGLRLPSDVVGIVTLVGILPDISAHRQIAWTGERSGHVVLRRKGARTSSTASAATEFVHPPSESSWGAWHEIVLAIVARTLQERPIHLLAYLGPTCDHEPSLSSVVGSDNEFDLHVRARHKFWNGRSRAIVPLLPKVKTSCVIGRIGAAGAWTASIWRSSVPASIRGSRLPPEQLGHPCREIVSHLMRERVFAQRL